MLCYRGREKARVATGAIRRISRDKGADTLLHARVVSAAGKHGSSSPLMRTALQRCWATPGEVVACGRYAPRKASNDTSSECKEEQRVADTLSQNRPIKLALQESEGFVPAIGRIR